LISRRRHGAIKCSCNHDCNDDKYAEATKQGLESSPRSPQYFPMQVLESSPLSPQCFLTQGLESLPLPLPLLPHLLPTQGLELSPLLPQYFPTQGFEEIATTTAANHCCRCYQRKAWNCHHCRHSIFQHEVLKESPPPPLPTTAAVATTLASNARLGIVTTVTTVFSNTRLGRNRHHYCWQPLLPLLPHLCRDHTCFRLKT